MAFEGCVRINAVLQALRETGSAGSGRADASGFLVVGRLFQDVTPIMYPRRGRSSQMDVLVQAVGLQSTLGCDIDRRSAIHASSEMPLLCKFVLLSQPSLRARRASLRL